jgi:hypothetical protein
MSLLQLNEENNHDKFVIEYFITFILKTNRLMNFAMIGLDGVNEN